MGILLIPAVEVRLLGADVIVLNVTAEEIAQVKNFDDLRRLRARRGNSIFTVAPHPFYVFGGSIGSRLFAEIDCFDAIEFCHFHIGPFNPNRRAQRVATRFGKPMIATSDAHRLHALAGTTRVCQCRLRSRSRTFLRIAQRPTAPNKSCFEPERFCERDLFRFPAHPFRVRRKWRSMSIDHACSYLERTLSVRPGASDLPPHC
jgi:hypothetical protein